MKLSPLLLLALGCSTGGQASPEFAAAQRALVEVQEKTLDPTYRDPAYLPVIALFKRVPTAAREYASAQELLAELEAAQRASEDHASQVAGARAAELAAERRAAEAERPAQERREAAERQAREYMQEMERQHPRLVVDPAELEARQKQVLELQREASRPFRPSGH